MGKEKDRAGSYLEMYVVAPIENRLAKLDKEKAGSYLETGWELLKDGAATAVDFASIVTPVVPKEVAEWGWDRLKGDGWFEGGSGTGPKYFIGAANSIIEVVGGTASLMSSGAVADEKTSAVMFGAGLYALVEGIVRFALTDYSSTLPVTAASYGARGAKKAAQYAAKEVKEAAEAFGDHVAKRYDEVVERREARRLLKNCETAKKYGLKAKEFLDREDCDHLGPADS